MFILGSVYFKYSDYYNHVAMYFLSNTGELYCRYVSMNSYSLKEMYRD